MVRDGLAALLERSARMKVVGTAATGTEAVLAAARLTPDVILMDLMLPELSGVDATRRILASLPQTHILILSACHTSEHVFLALRAGARGYVLKEAAGTDLVQAVAAVYDGERYLSPKITGAVIDGLLSNPAPQSPLERLSGREREVLQKRLSLSRKTVDTYRSRLMEKLGVHDRARLIHFAIEHAITPM